MTQSDRDEQESIEQCNDYRELKLEKCSVCGAIGLPERIDDHDCKTFSEVR